MLAGLLVGAWWLTRSESGADLADAVGAEDHGLARQLLDEGADPDEPRVFDLTPLMRAAIRDDVEMVRLLLEAGADLEATDGAGQTAWHLAAQRDAVNSLLALVEFGADLGMRSANGMNALEHAAAWGSVAVIEELASGGYDLNAPSAVVTQGHGYPRDRGSTPLGIAVWAGRVEAVEALISHGAAVDAVSTSGHTPLLIAVFADSDPALMSALLTAGADPSASAACVEGCSEGDHRQLDALGWAHELSRLDLVPLLEAAAKP